MMRPPGASQRRLPLALTVLRVLLAVLMGACVVGVIVALAVLFRDSSEGSTDSWNGLIAGLALLAAFFLTAVILTVGLMMGLIGRSPVVGAKVALVSGAVLCLLSWLTAPAFGTTVAGLFMMVGLPVAMFAAVGLFQLARASDRA